MQLLHTSLEGNEPRVIHIVYKGTSSPTQRIIPRGHGSNDQDAGQRRVDTGLREPSDGPLICRETITPRSEERLPEASTSQRTERRRSWSISRGLTQADAKPAESQPTFQTSQYVTPPTPREPSPPNTRTGSWFLDARPAQADTSPAEPQLTPQASHSFRHDGNDESPVSEAFLPQGVITAPEEFCSDTGPLSAPETFLPPDAAYPEYIHDTLAYASDLPPSRKSYYPLWTYVLEYWFPATEGFQVVEDWDPRDAFQAQQLAPQYNMHDSENMLPVSPKSSLTVFDTFSPMEPFLMVNIHNGMPVNDLSRAYAGTSLEETFETLRSCSFCAGFKTLCVVSAVGARWNMVFRETGWLEGETGGGGNDYVGQMEEDVTAPMSYRVMGYCFKQLKRSVLHRREERWKSLPTS